MDSVLAETRLSAFEKNFTADQTKVTTKVLELSAKGETHAIETTGRELSSQFS